MRAKNPKSPAARFAFKAQLALLVLATLACGGGNKKAAQEQEAKPPKPAAELSWQIRQIRITEPCKNTDAAAASEEATPCVTYLASYPEFEKGMARPLLARLNSAIKELATTPSFDERRAGSIDGTGRQLIAAWKGRIAEKNGVSERWSDQRKVTILHRDAEVISFRFEENLDAGGAHPLATVLYASYTLDRIDRLSMADLFVEGAASRLNELGEKKFREARKIAPGSSLADAGFDFPRGVFRLSSNFAVTEDGLIFRYNPYDIAAYAVGETEIVLPLAEVKDQLRPKGPLGHRSGPATPAPAADGGGEGESSDGVSGDQDGVSGDKDDGEGIGGG